MSELLVRVIDKINEDPLLDPQCTKAGDVIAARPDKWPWGRDELTLDQYRIVKLPDLPLVEAEALTTPERGDVGKDQMLQKRAFKIDFLLLAPEQAALLTDPRTPDADHVTFIDEYRKLDLSVLSKQQIETLNAAKVIDADAVAYVLSVSAAIADAKDEAKPVELPPFDDSAKTLVPAVDGVKPKGAAVIDADSVRSAKVQKPPLKNPFVIGPDDPLVIG